MGPDCDVHVSPGQGLQQELPALALDVSRDERDPDTQRFEKLGGFLRMLTRQQLGGSHECHLISLTDLMEGADPGYECLS